MRTANSLKVTPFLINPSINRASRCAPSATLELAEAAIKRMSIRGNVSVDEWATKLASDLASFDD
jgi:hypothetical protein